jgi:hypothetical protein
MVHISCGTKKPDSPDTQSECYILAGDEGQDDTGGQDGRA